MMELWKGLAAASATVLLLLPAAEFAAPAAAREAKPTKTKVYVTKKRWRGYGFLPGYRPWVNGLDRHGRAVSLARIRSDEPRFFGYYGNVYYGWGYPGFARGRWNGGSFGPCWTSTPIGMMPTCGQ
jgi:hypothetical protein